MADEKPPVNPWEPVLLVVGLLAVLLALLWARGGLSSLNTGDFFVSPVAPLQNSNQ